MKTTKTWLIKPLSTLSDVVFAFLFIFIVVSACTPATTDTSSSTATSTQTTIQSSSPTSPSNITAKLSKMTDSSGKWQVEISWKNSPDVAYYSIKKGETSKNYTHTYQKTENPFIIQNLEPNSTQYFIIIANVNLNNSILTVESTEYSIKVPIDDYIKKPGPFSASLSQSTTEQGKYTLSWTESTDDGATFYTIYKGITSGSYPDLVAYLPDVTSKTYTGSLAVDAPPTYFLIIAVNSKGSANSNEVKYEPNETIIPILPAIIPGSFTATASPGTESITLNWTESSDANTYVIQYGISADSFPFILDPLPSSSREFTVTNLTAGTVYYFNLIAVSVDTNSKNADSVVSETPTAPLPSYRSIVLANNPVSYWPLQETSGTTAADLSGHNFNGTYHGNVSLAQQTTVLNQSVKASAFNGTSSYISIPANSYNNLSQGTISVWVKLNDITQATVIAKQHDNCCTMGVLSIGMYAGGDGWNISGNPGVVYFHDDNYVTPDNIHSTTALTQGAWYHLSVVFSESGSTIYINGVASGTDTSRAFYLPDDSSPTSTTIGNWSFPNSYLNGMIAGLAVFPTVLSPSTIQSLYDSGGTW